jgi:hypothetical protein
MLAADIPEPFLELAEAPTVGGLSAQNLQGLFDRDDLAFGMLTADDHG